MLFNLSLSNTIQVGTLERGRKIGIKLLRRVFAPRKVERPPVVYNFILSMAVGPSGERWSGWSRNTVLQLSATHRLSCKGIRHGDTGQEHRVPMTQLLFVRQFSISTTLEAHSNLLA